MSDIEFNGKKNVDYKENVDKEIINKYIQKSAFTAEQETYLLLKGFQKYCEVFHNRKYKKYLKEIDKLSNIAFDNIYRKVYEYSDYNYLDTIVEKYNKEQLNAIVDFNRKDLVKMFCDNSIIKKFLFENIFIRGLNYLKRKLFK